jgi:hypothetical protein
MDFDSTILLPMLAGLRAIDWKGACSTGVAVRPVPKERKPRPIDTTLIPSEEVLPTPAGYIEGIPQQSKFNRKYTLEDEARGVFLRCSGYGAAAIGRGMGISRGTVETWHRKYLARVKRGTSLESPRKRNRFT